MDKSKYLILPTSEHLHKPKYMAFVDAILDNMIALGTVTESIGSAFDVNNAAGKQLDVIGELVNLPRLLPYKPTSGTREMDDDEYRLALNLKIARNEWDGTNGSAVEIIRTYLSDLFNVSFVDGQDNTVTYIITGVVSTRSLEILNSAGLLLVPSGIGLTVSPDMGDVDVTIYNSICISGMEMDDTVSMM